ncbi:MAG: ABC transporter substrate-binding protein [Clostridiales bacterium]|nr:ABC transporter substrate-binding protein [Candidatus Crickella merdequi]
MKSKRLITITALLMLVICIVTGCSGNLTDEDASGEYPLTVVDQAGREVTIDNEPESIVSPYYISTSLVMALGLGERLVGVEDNAQLRPIYQLSNPDILELQNVGSVKELDIEAVAALEPDLVILPMKLKSAVEPLEELGITVIIINPESQELLEESIVLVATATAVKERGDELLGFINEKKEFLTEKLKDTESVSVYMGGNSDFLSTASNGMYQNELIELAGGKNVAGEIEDTYWVMTSYEQLLKWNPSYIITASSAGYSVKDVLNNSSVAICSAVKSRNVYHMPDNVESIDSPVPGGILGAMWMANVLHPDVVSKDDYEKAVKDFYKQFYDVEVTFKK